MAIGYVLLARAISFTDLQWQNDAFIYYSDYVEGQLQTAFDFIVEKLASPDFKTQYVYRKYANKKFLKAAVFACDWAKRHVKSRG